MIDLTVYDKLKKHFNQVVPATMNLERALAWKKSLLMLGYNCCPKVAIGVVQRISSVFVNVCNADGLLTNELPKVQT